MGNSANRLLPIVTAGVFVVLFFSERLQTPGEKQKQIDRAMAPVLVQLERTRADFEKLDRDYTAHRALGGHAVMDRRMLHVEQKLDAIGDTLEEIKQKIGM